MPQNTNLNINPYYDDFDPSKNYNRVLFKPGTPIQARELTTLQSILQDQVEKFGKHFFKDGSVVIPGSIAYDANYYAVKIESTFFGVPLEAYYDKLVGLRIQGKTSGITAVVKSVLSQSQSEEGKTTLYVKYQNSSDQDYTTAQFLDGENLVTLETFSYGTTTITEGSDFATCVVTNATATGSSFSISEGVFFARGAFVQVSDETILLDQYTNTPSYRVGLFVNEEIITAVDDPSLYDNAQGYSNYTAPGADRLKISLSLIKKDLEDYQDENFIELFRVRNGETKKIVNKTVYSEIAKELARRTHDESGDYFVNQFDIQAKESLNDRYSTFGVFFPEENTDQGNQPSKDLLEIQVGPGKAYVKGYETQTYGSTFLDVEKPRTTQSVEGAGIPFQAGNLLRVNNVHGAASVGIATTGTVDLRSRRLGSSLPLAPTGQSIGRARVYDFKASNSAYSDASSTFDLYLFDIQTDTEITLNQELDISAPALIEGKNSGARGYLRSRSGDILTLHQTSGNFVLDEAILVNGIENGRIVTKVLEFDISDIKSVRSEVGVTTFSADTVLEPKLNFGGQSFNFSASSGGVSTVTSSSGGWTTGIKTGDIISYNRSDVSGTVYNRVSTVSPTAASMTVAAVGNVTNVATGSLPSSAINVSGVSVVSPRVINSNSGFLYAELPNQNVESVDLTTSDIFIRKEYRDRSSSSLGTLDLPSLTGTDFVYAPFDEERYTVVYKDGTVEALTSDMFQLTGGAKGATISGLSKTNETGVIVTTTQQKSKVTSKTKILNRAASLVVSGSKYSYSGVSTAVQDGLSPSGAYGKRVQDREISLDVADVVNVHAIFESSTASDPVVPSFLLSSLNGPNSNVDDLIIGEVLVGKTSGASAMVLGKNGTNQIYVVPKNNQNFQETEEVVFQESGVIGNINQINLGDKNILSNFNFDTGQRLEYYDFGRLIRKSGSAEPSRRLKVFFDYYSINSSDNGEIITASSYSDYDQSPSFNNVRNTDVIDFRPRVANYASNLSPFEFEARNFGGSGQSVPNVIVSDENIVLDYQFYLGRVDRLFLNQDSSLTVVQGTPAENPVDPEAIDSAFELARIRYAPYVYDVDSDVTIEFKANRRYTMLDIGKLEDRIESLEYYTSLSLLENKTQSLVIQDPDTGLDRFKSGFVVDNFSTFDVADKTVPELKYDIEGNHLVARRYFDNIDLLVGSESLIGSNGTPDLSVDLRYATDLGSPNIKKSKNIVTLNYSEAEDFKQPFASRVVNINPFDVVTWRGRMDLNPKQDVWIEREYKTIDGGFGTTEVITQSQKIPNLRPQNIEFKATRLKPGTKFFSFFSRTDMSDSRTYTVPKLLEVTPVQGAFNIGETVVGRSLANQNSTANPEIRFRLAAPNHKDGPYNSPTAVYSNNPYSNVGLSSSYSDTTTTLNIDTASLNQKSDERFFGYVEKGMKLVGETSGAEAIISDIRLISDNNGVLIGSMNIPSGSPKFTNGVNSVEVSAEKTPNNIPGVTVSGADADFYSDGTLVTQTTIVRRPPPPPPAPPAPRDPLAQSFFVEETPGIFLTSVDLFFASKSSSIPVELNIVTVENGTPTGNIIDGSSVVKNPDEISTSADGQTATTFTFDAPVYLATGEYAFVLLADTDAYNVWISRVGEEDISTKNLPEIQKVIINKQPSLGSLFKSQNASTWTASQLEDLKYVARKAQFVTDPGTFRFYNPELRTFNSRNVLQDNPIEAFSKKVTVGVSSAITSPFVVIGSEIRQDNRTSVGYVESLRGAIGLADTGLNITNAGVGYSNGTFSNVSFTSQTGGGTGAVGIVTVSAGAVNSVSVTASGSGYAIGDTLTATLGSNTLGRNLTLTVGVVTSVNTLVLANVTGQDFNTSDQIQYVPTAGAGVGVGSTLFSIVPTSVTTNTDEYDGTHFKVSHKNHGMHADNNIVTITGVSGDTVATTISVGYGVSSIDNISVASSTNFNWFEGAQVSASNPGFALVGDEIIAYTGVGANVLTGITTRGVDGTKARTYSVNTPIQKYEFSGVSLRKINTTHSLINVTNNIENKVGLDHYHVKISGSKLFNANKLGGGSNAKASQNIMFNSIVPNLNTTIPNGTSISGKVRTVSGTSVDGTETSFQDKGYEAISLVNETKFSDPRIVASRANEESKLLALPGAKSFTLELVLSTDNPNVSPVIDVFDSNITTISNRVNAPVSNYVTDRRSNLLAEDPHSLSYLTKVIGIENPATSLQVLLGAYRPASADIRVLYRLFRVDGSEIDKVFELFPGYDNLDSNGQVINAKNNSGRSDRQISASLQGQFSEYTFTANNLPQFSAYQIKVELTSTNQAQSPQLMDFRAIALA